MAQLKMPSRHREDLLRRLGYSRRDIMEGTKEANIARGRRKRTMETMTLAPAQELLELARRATLNATVKRASKKKEREMMECFRSPRKGTNMHRLSMSTAPTLGDSLFLMQQ